MILINRLCVNISHARFILIILPDTTYKKYRIILFVKNRLLLILKLCLVIDSIT